MNKMSRIRTTERETERAPREPVRSDMQQLRAWLYTSYPASMQPQIKERARQLAEQHPTSYLATHFERIYG